MTPWAKTMNERQARGQCRVCDGPAAPGKTLCEFHRVVHNGQLRRRRLARKEAGLCADCDRPRRPGGLRCAGHTEETSRYLAEYKRKRAAG